MEYHTFKEWSSAGYKINKGAKAIERFYGVPVFSREQVTPKAQAFANRPRRAFTRGWSEYTGDCSDHDSSDYPEYEDAYNAAWGGY